MKFAPPLVEALLIRRYKRFLADVEIGGTIVTVHCPNPGSMMGLAEPGSRCWLTPRTGTKLPYGWEIVESKASGETALVGINTGKANAIVAEGLAAGSFPGLPTAAIAREVKVGTASRLDFRLGDAEGRPCWVEVKSVTLSRRAAIAEFPTPRPIAAAATWPSSQPWPRPDSAPCCCSSSSAAIAARCGSPPISTRPMRPP